MRERNPWTQVEAVIAYRGPYEGREVAVVRRRSPSHRFDEVFDVESGDLIEMRLTNHRFGLHNVMRRVE